MFARRVLFRSAAFAASGNPQQKLKQESLQKPQTAADLNRLLQNNKVNIVEFSTAKKMAPVFSTLPSRHPSAAFIEVDVDQLQELSQKYNIKKTPTFVAIVDGKETERLEGEQDDKDLNSFIGSRTSEAEKEAKGPKKLDGNAAEFDEEFEDSVLKSKDTDKKSRFANVEKADENKKIEYDSESVLFTGLFGDLRRTFAEGAESSEAKDYPLVHRPTTEKQFSNLVSKYPNSVIAFYANGCGMCAKMLPTFEGLVDSNASITFIEVDVHKLPKTCLDFNISMTPTFVSLSNGAELHRCEGANEEGLKILIEGRNRLSREDEKQLSSRAGEHRFERESEWKKNAEANPHDSITINVIDKDGELHSVSVPFGCDLNYVAKMFGGKGVRVKCGSNEQEYRDNALHTTTMEAANLAKACSINII